MNPFRGLLTYQAGEGDVLFGRDRDATLVEGRILAARTMVLFAGSGVGKSSFLQAKLVPRLANVYRVVFQSTWSDRNPLASMAALVGGGGTGERDLRGLLEKPSEKPFLFVLDQFEEVFQYHQNTQELQDLVAALAGAVNEQALNIRLLLSMREEFLGELSVFDNLIPELFGNYYRLKNPSRSDAIDIISSTAALANVECNEAKLDLLVEDLQRIVAPVASDRKFILDQVAPPYLQIVCHGIWNDTDPQPGGTRFLEEYRAAGDGEASEASLQLSKYCAEKLGRLTEHQQELAADAFNYLITRGGAKKAYRADTLADLIGSAGVGELTEALSALAAKESRILRQFKDPDGQQWFELYHDMYAQFLSDWKAGVESTRKQRQSVLEAEARSYQERERTAKLRRSILLYGGLGLVGILLVFGFYEYVYPKPQRQMEALKSENYPDVKGGFDALAKNIFFAQRGKRLFSDYWIRRSQTAMLQNDGDAVILCALNAAKADANPASVTLANAVLKGERQDLEKTYVTMRPLRSAEITRDGRTVIGVPMSGSLLRWDRESANAIPTPAFASQPEASGLVPGRASQPGPAGAAAAAAPPPPASVVAVDPVGRVGLAVELPGFRGTASSAVRGTAPSSKAFLFDVGSGRQIGRAIEFPGALVALAQFSPGGSRVALVSDTSLNIIDVPSGYILTEQIKRNQVGSLAFTADDSILAAAEQDGVWAWRLGQGKAVPLASWRIPKGQANAYPLGGPRVATLGNHLLITSGQAAEWDPVSGQFGRNFGSATMATGSPDAKLVLLEVGLTGSLLVESAATGQAVAASWENPGNVMWTDGKSVLSVSTRSLRLWKCGDQLTGTFPAPPSRGYSTLNPDGTRAAAVTDAGVMVYSAFDGRTEMTLPSHLEKPPAEESSSGYTPPAYAGFFPDGKGIIESTYSGGSSGTRGWAAWDAKTGAQLEFPEAANSYMALAAGNSVVIRSYAGHCEVWAANDLAKPKVDIARCLASAASPDGKALAMIASDGLHFVSFDGKQWGKAEFYPIAIGEMEPGQTVFDAARRRVAWLSPASGRSLVWSVKGKRAIETPLPASVREVVFDPLTGTLLTLDGERLASWSISEDGGLRKTGQVGSIGNMFVWFLRTNSRNVYLPIAYYVYMVDLSHGTLSLIGRPAPMGMAGGFAGLDRKMVELQPVAGRMRRVEISFRDEPLPSHLPDFGALLKAWEKKLGMQFNPLDGSYAPVVEDAHP